MKTKRRNRYNVTEKLAAINAAEILHLEGDTPSEIAKTLGYDRTLLLCWEQNREKLQQMSKKAKSKSTGRPSDFQPIAEELLQWHDDVCESLEATDFEILAEQAATMLPDIDDKSDEAWHQCARRFAYSNGLAIRDVTSKLRQEADKDKVAASQFVTEMRCKFQDNEQYDTRFIINMDETGIPYYKPPKTTLERKGATFVAIKVPKNSRARVTAALAVTASGELLTPMIIFRGTPGGDNQEEVEKFPGKDICVVQKSNYMDTRVMHMWCDQVLYPYIKTRPPGVIPVLLMDNFSAHITPTVAQKLRDMNVEVQMLPPNCTQWIQPLDWSVNGPLKYYYGEICRKWRRQQVATGVFDHPTRELIAKWCNKAFNLLTAETIQSGWLNDEFPYFIGQ
jgi:DDE superfamily endonuclease